MASGYSSPGAGQPLSIGNVISAGLRLYRDHFKQYFGVAFLATLWILLPIAVAIGIALFFAAVQSNYGLLALLIPAWIVLLLYCSGRYMAGTAAIARLAFGELSNQPETTQQARRFTQSRQWWYLLTGVLVGLIFFGLFIAFYLALTLFVVAMLLVLGGGDFQTNSSNPEAFLLQFFSNPGTWGPVVLGVVVLLVLFLTLVFWLGARLSIAQVPLSIESDIKGTQTIGRSWSLTKRSAWRILLVLFILFLVMLPLQLVVQIIVTVLQAAMSAAVPSDGSVSAAPLIGILLTYLVSFTAGILLVPLRQSVLAAIYYDLRSRREGLGLELRD
jgi:Membrane domain of glycerophosphoryl diester phosphodiesterase